MPSPFPGVDPYLEATALWPGFHDRFIVYLSDAINDSLPPGYWVNVEERVTAISLPGEERQSFVGDVGVASRLGEPLGRARSSDGAIATLEPVAVQLQYEEPVAETYLEVLKMPERELVTAIEVLSPSNKEAPGREVYRRKRDTFLNQYVHLIEIDFLIRGSRLPMNGPLPGGDHFVLVSRADRRPMCDVFAWTIRRPVPTIDVPLKGDDPALRLDLQAVWASTFERGRYGPILDYTADPPVFLRAEDRAWARELLNPKI